MKELECLSKMTCVWSGQYQNHAYDAHTHTHRPTPIHDSYTRGHVISARTTLKSYHNVIKILTKFFKLLVTLITSHTEK